MTANTARLKALAGRKKIVENPNEPQPMRKMKRRKAKGATVTLA